MSDKKLYVYSTLSASVNYQVYGAGGGDLPVAEQSIVIHGGANIPDKYMQTPFGVANPVTEQELELLRQDKVFQLHEKGGFVTVRDKPADVEKVAADMTGRDQSAPLVDADFQEGQEPKTGPVDEDDKPAPKTNNRRA